MGSGGMELYGVAQNLPAGTRCLSKKKGRIREDTVPAGDRAAAPIGEHQGLAVWPVKKVLRWHALASSVRVSALEGMLRLYGP
jgi:hypothetical protein